MKTAEEIAKGFNAKDRNRALYLVKVAQKEGVVMTASVLDGMFDPTLDDSEMIQVIRQQIKELKEVNTNE